MWARFAWPWARICVSIAYQRQPRFRALAIHSNTSDLYLANKGITAVSQGPLLAYTPVRTLPVMQQGTALARPSRLSRLVAWFEARRLNTGWRAYAFALVSVAAITLVRWLIDIPFNSPAPLLPFLVPVVVVAFFAGLRPALVATVLGWFIAHRWFSGPLPELGSDRDAIVIAALFLGEGALLAWAGDQAHQLLTQLMERDRQLALNEERLQMAQRAARIATYEWHPATNRALWSENAEEVMGMPPGSFQGTFDDTLRTTFPEDRPLVEAAARELFERGSNELVTRVKGPDGETRWIRATATLAPGQNGQPDRVVGVMMDVSEQRHLLENEQFLADATADLSLSLDYRTAVASAARAAVPRFCDMATVVLVNNGEFPGEIIERVSRNPDRIEAMTSLQKYLQSDPGKPGVLGQAIRSGQPLFIPKFDDAYFDQIAQSPEHRAILRRMSIGSVICVPLRGMERPLGGLIFATEADRRLTDADYQTALELGRRASLAIENALLVEYSFEREAQAHRANEALQLLADSGVTLSRSLDVDEMLTSLAELVVPRFADVCSISLGDPDGPMDRVGFACANEELRQAMEQFAATPAGEQGLVEQAAMRIRAGRPVFLPDITDELRERFAVTPEHAIALSAIKPCSLIVMPMTARGQTVGVMSFLRTGESPRFDRDDLSLAGQLGRRTGISADNARLYLEATRANDAKDEFLGMMSHELRTPITVIHGGARVLRSRAEHLDRETRDGLLNDIERESERLSRMLENLLALARAELDGDVTLEPVLLQRLLPRLIESQGPATGRVVTLRAEGDAPAVAAEPGYIEHIVRNLVGNARKYSPPDAPIEVVLAGREGGAAVKVLDRGFGIAGDEAGKIFERFYRSDRTSRLAGGAGLGLAVCKRLVEAMSGEIWATPREGGGLEVGFSLPAYREEHVEL